jgi:hypothetical protein
MPKFLLPDSYRIVRLSKTLRNCNFLENPIKDEVGFKENPPMAGMRQFELLEDLAPGRSARAVILKWDGKNYSRSNQVVQLHDFVGVHGDRGDRGYAFLSEESGQWEAAAGLFEQVAGWLPS